ncbi:MAG TPA: zinc ABC transporter substrate-binding protein, partial [Actinomycetospora sp.]|nr:zinc ABC transporter substrate-binding protein [Actinomycetospora sp.]
MMIPSAVRGAGRRVGRPHRTWLVAVVALGLGLVAACGSGGQQPPAPSAAAPGPAPAGAPAPPARTLTVVASTNVWGDIATRVAGPTAQVRSILADPNADPHSYEGTPADAA